jgi:hypothetical protein
VRERGLMKYKWQEWRPAKPRCLLTRDVVSVELGTISFAFLLLVFGLFASVSILIIERLHHDRYFHFMTIVRLTFKSVLLYQMKSKAIFVTYALKLTGLANFVTSIPALYSVEPGFNSRLENRLS